jgi:uncharacterized membrane protein
MQIDAPSHTDPVVRSLSGVIGGPPGRFARLGVRKFWTPMRVVLAIACAVLALGWIQKAPCADGAWTNGSQYTNYCYTDVLALYYAEGLNEGKVPYLDHPVEYPVLTGALMGAVGLPVHWLGERGWIDNESRAFYLLTTLVLALFALLTVWAIVRMRRRRPFDAAMVAAAPAMVFTAYVNWDLLAIGLCTLGIYAWSRRNPVWAGVLLGLAGAAKFYPLMVLGPLLVLCLRAGRMRQFAVTLGSAVVAWAAVNLPVLLAAPDAWARFYRFSSERGVDWGTFWYVASHVKTPGGSGPPAYFTTLAADIPRVNIYSGCLFGLACVAIAALALMATRRPRLAQLVFLVVAAFLLTNKVWSQQFVLWLVPLAVLARPKWGAFLVWQACELGYFLAFYQTLLRASPPLKSLMPEWAFLVASSARAISLLVLCGLVVREILRPETDVVRAPAPSWREDRTTLRDDENDDDPEGGVLSGAEDIRVLTGAPVVADVFRTG